LKKLQQPHCRFNSFASFENRVKKRRSRFNSCRTGGVGHFAIQMAKILGHM
jgi:hypothetical protein